MIVLRDVTKMLVDWLIEYQLQRDEANPRMQWSLLLQSLTALSKFYDFLAY